MTLLGIAGYRLGLQSLIVPHQSFVRSMNSKVSTRYLLYFVFCV